MARSIVIIGGGAAGTLVALHLARVARIPTEVSVIEPRSRLAEGVAYGTTNPTHLLNVPAAGMSAFDEEPNGFVAWAGCAPGDFVARARYAEYLRAELAHCVEANPSFSLRHVRDSATRIDVVKRRVTVSSGESFTGQSIVIALGNAAPMKPAWIESYTNTPVIADPWQSGALDTVTIGSRVLCVGTGLTFVDVSLSLARRGAKVTGVSRHGLLPAVHAHFGSLPSMTTELSSPVSVSRWIRAQDDWRAALATLRTSTQRLWRSFTMAQQAQFLRHARRHWDVHRHRMAAEIAEQLEHEMAVGNIEVHRGDARTFAESRSFDFVVLCTGPDDAALLRAAPLASLAAEGTICAGPHGMGIATDADTGQVHDSNGQLVEGLYAVGPLRRGTLWESTAVPEIRSEARRLASLLLV